MKKQVKLEKLPNLINKLAKEGLTITRCVKNGKEHRVVNMYW